MSGSRPIFVIEEPDTKSTDRLKNFDSQTGSLSALGHVPSTQKASLLLFVVEDC